MPGEAEGFARVTETTAVDIEAARFSHDRRYDEDRHEHRQDEHPAAIQNARNQSQSAENLKPGQIERQPHPDRPGQRFVILDISRKPDRIQNLDHPRIDEQPSDDNRDKAPGDLGKG